MNECEEKDRVDGTELIQPVLPNLDPLESGIEFFLSQKKYSFLVKYKANRIFLNNVDSYNGRHILRYIGSREFVKHEELEEVEGERNTIPTIPDSASRPSSSDSNESTESQSQDTSANQIDKKKKLSNVDKNTLTQTKCEFDDEDSLMTILGGLITTQQISVMRSLPHRTQRAQYLKDILNQIETEPLPEEPVEPSCYEIVGTLQYCDVCLPEILIFLKERIIDIKSYLPALLNCSTVIYDISRDPSQIEEARWALKAILCSLQYLEKNSVSCFNKIKDVRKFILISSVMTWENTDKIKIKKKPLSEDSLHLRKPHILFKEHKYLEQEVMRAGDQYPNIFKTFVIASGIPYGQEEDRFNYLFDLGWNNESVLPLLGNGHNALPIIHIEDLAMIVFYCLSRVYTTPNYYFAVEKDPPTLLQITESVSRGLTTGQTEVYATGQPLPPNINIHEDTYAMLTSEILLEPKLHSFDLPWKFSINMVNNMAAIIDEYIESRHLCPFKILVGGPPLSGKTMLALKIAEIYDLKYISIEDIVLNYIRKLEEEEAFKIREVETKFGEGTYDDVEEEQSEYDEDEFAGEGSDNNKISRPGFKNELEEILLSMQENNGVPQDHIMVRILKKRLEDQDVLNHGYIVDGWPQTSDQAKLMFGKGDLDDDKEEELIGEMHEEDEEEKESDAEENEEMVAEDQAEPAIKYRNINIQPNILIQLDGDCDEILFNILVDKEDLERNQPSSIELAQKMQQYRELEKTCCRAFDYFDNNSLEMKIFRYQVSADRCPFMGLTLKNILDTIGPPTNLGFLNRYLDEYKVIKKVQDDHIATKNSKRADEVHRMDLEYFKSACDFMDKWVNFKDSSIKEKSECGGLDYNLLPEKVVEITVKALMIFKKTTPENHLAFLAEYFLREYELEQGKCAVPVDCEDASTAFRRCVDTVLRKCDPACLELLPQAVDVIMKYRRFALAKGIIFPPESCQQMEVGDGDSSYKTGKINKTIESSSEMTGEDSSDRSVYFSYVEDNPKDKAQPSMEISIEQMAEILMKTNPIWKEKMGSIKKGNKGTISDESLRLLLEQLRQLSCEIQYRLKKRGVTVFDNDSPLGSLGEWPAKGPEKECSGEVRPSKRYTSSLSIDTKGKLIKMNDDLLKQKSEKLAKYRREEYGMDEEPENLKNLNISGNIQSSNVSDSNKKKSLIIMNSSEPNVIIPENVQKDDVDKKPSIDESDFLS